MNDERRVGPYLIPVFAVLATIIAPLVVWDRLPDPVASHWNGAGTADGSMPRTLDWLLLSGTAVLLGLLPIALRQVKAVRAALQMAAGIAAGGAVFTLCMRLLTLWANLDRTDWRQARPLPLVWLGGAVLVALAFGGLGALLARGAARTAPEPVPPGGPTTRPLAGKALPWSGSADSPVLAIVLPVGAAILGTALALTLESPANVIVAASLAVVAVAGVLFGRATAQVDAAGLTVRLGWFGWPRVRVPLAQIAEVEVEQVEPMAYGGWGLRTVPGATAVVIRRGEGIRVRRTSGRVLVVTVDNATVGAATLLAYTRLTDPSRPPAE